MKYFVRIGASAVVAAALAAGLSGLAGPWLGEDMNVAELGRWMLRESRRTEAISALRETVDVARTRKNAVVDEVLAGRLTLVEAAVKFREADEAIEHVDPETAVGYSTPETEEGVCAQVVVWVRAESERLPPAERQRIIRSIEQQFEDRFGSAALAAMGQILP